MKDRLAELESRVAFQDNTIQELNDVIVKQQHQLDQLLLQYREIKDQLQTLTPSLLAQISEESPPPHY
ncbi:MAG: SlyX family protein [Gammaproteobacteria bacterium]|jgi:SlyX protein